jgi:hypothetical protein
MTETTEGLSWQERRRLKTQAAREAACLLVSNEPLALQPPPAPGAPERLEQTELADNELEPWEDSPTLPLGEADVAGTPATEQPAPATPDPNCLACLTGRCWIHGTEGAL